MLSEAGFEGVNFIVLPDRETAGYCAADLYDMVEGDCVFFLPDSGKSIEKSNFKSSLAVQRTSAIGKLLEWKSGDSPLYIVTYPAAIGELIPDTGKIGSSVIKLKVGQEVDPISVRDTLFNAGFEKVDFVSEPGHFAVRGGLLDIFSYSENNPFRVSFFGDEIDKITQFSCDTQLSISDLDEVEIFPDITLASDEKSGVGITEILPEKTLVWLDSPDLYSDKDFYKNLEKKQRVFIGIPLEFKGENSEKIKENIIVSNFSPQPVFNKNFELLTEDIRQKIEAGYEVKIYGEKLSQLDRLKSILKQNGGLIPDFVSEHNIHAGFIDNDSKICAYSDHEIFDRFHRINIRRTVQKSEQMTVNDLTSFSIGDYIVHIDYGVGIFGGLVRMKDDKGRMHDVVKLMYKDGDVLFLSVHSLHKISRFRSKDSEPPKIHKLGSKSWQNLKTNTKKKVKDIAKDLIQLYAKRKAEKGFAFSPDSYLQEELESSFIYEDTPDQEKAVKAVKMDMEADCPMDRLVCGDVGFGKTEVAIRAAFKAVTDSKQVAVLVPTTILALQHYNTFKGRLKNFPCNIDYVSRLRTAKEITDIKKRLESGSIDIVIGTHKILSKDFKFKDLGLLIIDEEQKFGVSAKEKLRQLKMSVDTLTLTATPIPRTLQFSLLGARDLSIINTPPPNRIPVQTEILLFDEKEIKAIIDYEVNRGGQVFFLHNRVEELKSIYDILTRLEPDLRICIAHGQMEAKVLENKIIDFMEGQYDILLCTTIIENGLDVPNANTIIINQAQNIGLSDLHQLRGRVGRSNKKAFCYLIVPPLMSITDDARRRLQAIEAFSDLGSGFNIAMQDLDIRGAGNLLGAEQSGFITDMGFEAYQKILSEAMDELGVETGITVNKDNGSVVVDCTIETDQVALIPDSYINIPVEKMRIYKDLDSVTTSRGVKEMRKNIEDRFGHIPEELDRLFDIVRIRILSEKLGFEKVIIKNGILIAFFVMNPMSNYYKSKTFTNVLSRVQDNAGIFELKQTDNRLKVIARNVDTIAKALSYLRLLGDKNN